MRNLLPLIAAAAIVACSDAPVQPASHGTGAGLIASADVAAGETETTTTDDATGSETTDGATESPTSPSTAPASALRPLVCPSPNEVRSARGVIGSAGGVIGVRGHELRLPPDAVTEPTEFEIVVPISDYMQIEVHAVGRDSYLFEVPASITISFQRCTSLPSGPLAAAYVDRSNRIVENMGGAVDRTSKKVTFPTAHLSGYIVAY